MADDRITRLKQKVAQLPFEPGVYQFLDTTGKVIYVGKAKSLRKRVSSYFVDSRDHSIKVRALVAKIADLRHIVVSSERDALLLENSLIKSLQPRYNILLKDDKTYPWIVVRNAPFPRVESTRRVIEDRSLYFGPYSSAGMQHELLELLHALFPIRTCKENLSAAAIAKGRYRPCLKYHIGACKAPCVARQTAEEYDAQIELVKEILRGNLRPVREYLTAEMQRASDGLRFEEAEAARRRLAMLEGYSSKSVIVNSRMVDTDVVSLVADEGDSEAYINFVRIVSGSIVNTFTAELSVGADEEPAHLLSEGIRQISEKLTGGLAAEVIVPMLPEIELFPNSHFTVPQRGDKLDLLRFSEKSATIYRAEKLKNIKIKNPERHTDRLMEAMRTELRLPREPRHIECFDNSNLQGTNPVASCVVFRDGKPSTREYRHYNVKTVVGADDFASMREIVGRRYRRLLDEGAELPDLVVVDGGKGQLHFAYDVFRELGIDDKVPIVGLAKRIEEVYYPNDPMPYYLKRTGEPLKVIMHIRDEAHRFGITFHRNKRSKAFINSELERIDGIGGKSIEALMQRFRTVSGVKRATTEELTAVVGATRAARIREYFGAKE